MSFLRRVSSTSRGASWGGSGPRTRWSDYVSQLAWEHLEILLEELEELSWVSLGVPAQTAAPANRPRISRR